jgi:hypothetical protein
MGMRDNARRNLRDWTTSDENIIGKPGERVGAFERSPEYKISKLSQALPKMTSEERAKNLQDLRTYIDYYHIVHQGEKQVPIEMNRAFREIAEKSNRLTLVENARLALELRGGPPTNRTIQESLERSAAQRAQTIEQYAVKPTLGQEWTWRDLQPQQDRKQGQVQVQVQERTQTRAADIAHTPAPSVATQVRVEPVLSLPPQTTAEPVKLVQQQTVMEPAKQLAQQVIAEPVKVVAEPAKLTQQTITENTKSPQDMSKDELRAKMDQIDQRLSELAARRGSVSLEQFRQDTTERKALNAEFGKYDSELADRLSKEIRQNRHGHLQQEPSWKDLHPKSEQTQTQQQAVSQDHKHEQQQSRSRSQGMEVSA